MNWIVSIFLPLSCAAEECMAPLGKRSGKNTERRKWLLLLGPVTSSVVWHFVCHPLFKVVHLLQLCVSHQAAVLRDTVKKSSENLEPSLRAPCIAVPPPRPPGISLHLSLLHHFRMQCQERRGISAFQLGFCFHSPLCPLSWLQVRLILQETTGKVQSGKR